MHFCFFDSLKSRITFPRKHIAALGCGLLLVMSSAPVWAQTLTLNLKDAELSSVIATVSEMTGRNFIVDPRVKGKVTVVSSEPMDAAEIYEVFLSVLSVHGFAAVPTENAIKIVPEVNAKQDAIPTVNAQMPGQGDAYVTRVIPVENVSAAQLVPILRPLLPQQAHLVALPSSNVLIASAAAANVQRLVDIIRRVDLTNDRDVEVIRLQHASASEVVRILQALQGAAGGQPAAGEGPVFVADERTNSVLLSGGANRLRLRTIISHLDTPLESGGGNTEVIFLRYADATELAEVLRGISNGLTEAQQGKGQTSANTVTIQAHEANNAIIVNAPPDILRALQSVIRRLDVRRAQVLVEAVIAEVSSQAATELGVQWVYDGSPADAPVGLINFGGSGAGIAGIAAAAAAGNLTQVPDGLIAAVGDTATSGGTRFGALIRALAGTGDTNILSTPTLLTLDNEEAEIVVGQNVPFVTGSYTSPGGTGSTPTNPFQTIQREDVGLTLTVKPQINEGNAVKLEIAQEVSSVAAATTGAADLITDKRSLRTTVLVDDGQAVVLGGLIDDNLRESIQKVPVLGDIPVLGWLFSHKRTQKEKRNLMVFLRPVILRTAGQAAAVSGEKYSYLRARQLDVRQRGVALMPDEASPLLPEMAELLKLPPSFEAWAGQQGLDATDQ